MKKLLLFLVANVSGLLLYSQQNGTESEKAVQQVIINTFDALSKRDSSALRAACTADVLFLEYGLEWNIDTLIRKGITENQAADFRRINTLDFISTTIRNDVAWVVYRNKADITSNAKQRKIEWMESVVLIRENDKWKIKLLHSTLIKRD